MKAPEKRGMKVDGRMTDMENFLLSHAERPLPKAPTHYVVADVLNTDLSVKRVTIYFNPSDRWKSVYGLPENAKGIGAAIGDGLAFLGSDPNTLAYKFWVVSIATDTVVHTGCTYSLNKCEA